MSRVLSGIQPTGNLHLGNYLGAMKNWVDIQSQHECLFCIVDLHAITVPQEPSALREATLTTAAAYIACGIIPEKSIIFHQSSVSQHAELAWLFSAMTPLGWLNRMTQFKEKAGKNKEQSCLGLYSYPVLMAADILLYHSTNVPVGEDQKQHLELARDIAGAFNRQYKQEYFKLPEPMITGVATRVMSLRDGLKKMSKSEESDFSRINLTDDADAIRQKIKKAKSDMEPGISYDIEKRPEVSNLINIFTAITDGNRMQIVEYYASCGMAQFKEALADAIIAHLEPIRKRMIELKKDEQYLAGILKQGTERASDIAGKNMVEIKRIMGFFQG